MATWAPPIEKKLMCWVRPGVLDAKARPFWLHRMLIAVDLPALERPAKAISGTVVRGRSRRWLTVVKKRACQSLDMGKATKEGKNAGKLLYNKGLRIVAVLYCPILILLIIYFCPKVSE